MTGDRTVWWYGVGLRPEQIERLARCPGWEPAGLARTADAVTDPRGPVDLWLVQASDLAEALRSGRIVRERHRQGDLCLLLPPQAPADVWQAAAAALLGPSPGVRVVSSLDRLLDEPRSREAPAPSGAGKDAGRPPGTGPSGAPAVAVDLAGTPAGTPPGTARPALGSGTAFHESSSPPAGGSTGQLVAVVGAKGGAGRTWLACELAVAAAAHGLRTALVDAHWTAADVTAVLDLPAGPTVLDLQPLLEGTDEAWSEQWLVHARSGVRVLAAPPRPELAGLIEPRTLPQVLRRAVTAFELVVVDAPPTPGGAGGAWREGPDPTVLVVTTPEPGALRRTRLWLEDARAHGGLGSHWGVVVNRWNGADSARAETERYLGSPVVAWIPDDPEAVQQATAAGLPLGLAQPGHAVAEAVAALLGVLLGEPVRPQRGGALRRLWHRWRPGTRVQDGAARGVRFGAG
ncbi:hypothetical protein Tmar_1203 [Thermaerobacter marianensis DSM 12885]|uniref:Uncharacterized protein n=1 Tax=Thermaerobacter marianensis (strain ATCC 700841 / DSM 12885 / JCM 10246 / 7p75a) TaxID=644966 RepID=E6SL85_THEM7|nr:hypothetical protein [Thermaerobacter marianensis]ADU51316.1 hypothetical protein Tmar_1203 [Thermaerobacter marianensis DSM 12885]